MEASTPIIEDNSNQVSNVFHCTNSEEVLDSPNAFVNPEESNHCKTWLIM